VGFTALLFYSVNSSLDKRESDYRHVSVLVPLLKETLIIKGKEYYSKYYFYTSSCCSKPLWLLGRSCPFVGFKVKKGHKNTHKKKQAYIRH